MHTNLRQVPPIILCLLLSSTLLAGEEPVRYDQIHLSAEATQETDNDTLIAVLSAQKEGSDPGILSDSVNRLIEQALSQAKQQPGIKVQTLGYRTSPVYQQQRLSGWRVKQSLRLESRDSEGLSRLLSKLQTSLALESISYSVSDERRQAVEEELIKEALAGFRRRAQLITEELDRNSYRLVEVTINNSSRTPQPMLSRARMMAVESAAAPPKLEAGQQTLRVEISGTIELQLE